MENTLIVMFTTMFVLLFFAVGSIIGWLVKHHLMETSHAFIHPEFFDQNGNVLPDEILAIRFENDYYDENDNEETD